MRVQQHQGGKRGTKQWNIDKGRVLWTINTGNDPQVPTGTQHIIIIHTLVSQANLSSQGVVRMQNRRTTQAQQQTQRTQHQTTIKKGK